MIDQSCHLGRERSMSLQRGNTTESILIIISDTKKNILASYALHILQITTYQFDMSDLGVFIHVVVYGHWSAVSFSYQNSQLEIIRISGAHASKVN